MAAFNFHQRRTRRWWYSGAALLAAALFSVFYVAGAGANLSGSTFEGNDGNMVVNTSGNLDWANVPNPQTGVDVTSGSSDNAFGQGSKEDSADVSIVDGSIPPNKNDLTRFYEASQVIGTGASQQVFLYLAWERLVNIGNANLDFEINQAATTGFTSSATGPLTIVRTNGDMLVTYDFGGSGTPTLGLNRWLTVGGLNPTIANNTTVFNQNSDCFSANTLPCWGDHVALSGTNSEGAVNAATITDPLNSNANVGIGLFGEAAINLTGAGVFKPGACSSFASTFVKARSSSSFGAELKDFIAPQPTNISNCGEIKIIKHTNPRGLNQDFSYTSNLPAGTVANVGGVAGVDASGNFKLNDNGNTTGDSTANTVDEKGIQQGTYTVTEGADPAGFKFASVTCTNNGSGGTTSSTTNRTATIVLAPDQIVTCTYVNNQQLGAIKITKTTSKTAGTGLDGATFSITKGGTAITGSPFTTANGGVICVDNLAFGDYVVTETGAPTGYAIDDSTGHTVTVDTNAKCSDATYVGESLSFTDTPLTDLHVHVASEASGGTQSNVKCVAGTDPATGTAIGNSPQPASGNADPVDLYADAGTGHGGGLAPGTYTCTITIDP